MDHFRQKIAMFRSSHISIKPPRMRLFLAQLAVCFFVFVGASRGFCALEIICSPNPGDQVTCSIIGGYIALDAGLGNVVQNENIILCTNCVNMTPSECISLKERLKGNMQNVANKAQILIAESQQLLSVVSSKILEFEQYEPWAGYVQEWEMEQYEYDAYWASISRLPTVQFSRLPFHYEQGFEGGNVTDGWYSPYLAAQVVIGNDSFLDGSYQIAQDCLYTLKQAEKNAEQIQKNSNTMYDLALSAEVQIDEQMSCDPCSLGKGALGGGGTGSEGGVSSAINQILYSILGELQLLNNHLSATRTSVENLETKFDNYSQAVLSQFGSITNLLKRLDDYVFPEFTNSIYSIRSNVIYIANSLGKGENFMLQAFSNATYNVTKEGTDAITEDEFRRIFNGSPDAETGSTFDMAEYFGIENWFSRMELLMMNIAGLTQISNATVTSQQDEERFNAQFEETDEKAKELESITTSFKEKLTQNYEKYQQFINDFNPLKVSDKPVMQITFLPHVSLESEGALVSKIDPIILDLEYGETASISTVVEVARTMFTLIWQATLLIADVLFFIWLSKVILGVTSFVMMYMRDFFR